MIVQRHIKKKSRARDKGRSAADGTERMSPSSARALSRGVRLIIVTSLLIVPLIALLIVLAPASPETSNITDKTKAEAWMNDPPPENPKPDTSIKIDEPQPVDKGRNYVRHRNPDGSYTIAISSGTVNYYNGTEWDAIDTRIVDRYKTKGNRTISGRSTEVLGDEYRYVMEKAGYHAYFPEMFTEAPIRFTAGSHEFSFKTLSVGYAYGERGLTGGENNFINSKNTAANPSGSIITYPNVFTDGMDVDAEYSLYKTGLKEFWILKDKPRPPEDPDDMLGFNTEISYDSDMYIDGKLVKPGDKPLLTSSEIEFRDKNGETVFRLPRPYALDAKREHVFCTYEIQKTAGKILLKNLVPWSWLDDPERAYPVRIDASPETLSAGFSVVCVGGSSWLSTYISSGHWHDDTYRTGIDFDTTAIPDTATITKVELKLYIDEEATPLNNDVAKMTSTAEAYYDANNYSGFNSDVDGNEYLSDSSGFAGTGSYHTVELTGGTGDACTDLQNQLGDNWFSVGFTGTTEADDKYRDGHTYLEANPPQIIVTYTGGVGGVTAYQVQNILADLSLDTECETVKVTLTGHETIEMIENAGAGCSGAAKEDKVKFTVATTAETDLLTAYFDNGGYASNMIVTCQSSGNDINFKSKNIGGTFKIYLYEANPDTGALIGDPLDIHSETVTLNVAHVWTDLSGLEGVVSSGNTFAFKMSFTPADATSSDIEIKFGAYGVAGKQMLFNIDETAAPVSAVISGTITPLAAKGEIVSGGKTIIIDLTEDTWVAEGATFDAQRQNIIDGITSAQSETTGWNNEVKAKQGVTGVVRTDDDTVTITLDAQPGYDITADETITVTVPASALVTSGSDIVATPTFNIMNSTCKFLYRRSITIDHTNVGTDNSGTLPATGFPVLVSITMGGTEHWLKWSGAHASGHVENEYGWDIIFRESDGKTQLYHEIEEYDKTTGTLVAWVRVDNLSKETDTTIYMYYGNDCITSPTEDPDNVWDDNYKGVWHLEEQVTDEETSGTHEDSTGVHDGSQVNNDDYTGEGRYAQTFDGTNDFIDIADHDDFTFVSGGTDQAFSVSAWIQGETNRAVIVCKDEVDSEWDLYLHSDGRVGFELYDPAWDYIGQESIASVSGGWQHVVATYDGSETSAGIKIYIDGVAQALNLKESGIYDGMVNTADNVEIGAYDGGNTEYDFNGMIDEVRVSDTARNADWIRTCYNNQVWPNKAVTPDPDPSPNPASGFLSVSGSEESSPATAVELISFTATGQGTSVLVEWETAQEINNLGFNLYRINGGDGSCTKLNSMLIPGLVSSVRGRKYTYTDEDAIRGELYYYLLEDVDLEGTITAHGPVCVDWDGEDIPDDHNHNPQPTDDASDTDMGEDWPETGIPVDPLDTSGAINGVILDYFKAYQQDGGNALEWKTNYEVDILGFHVYREVDFQFYRITPNIVPGSVFKVGAGKELPAGQSYVFWDALSVPTGREIYWLECRDANGGRACFGPAKPEVSAQLPTESLRKRFDTIAKHQLSKTQAFWRIRKLRKELESSQIQEGRLPVDFRRIIPKKPFEPRLPPGEEQWILSQNPAVKILVREEGWYRVGQPELTAVGLDPGVDPRYLQLYTDGQELPMIVTGSNDGWFDSQDSIEFYGRGLDTPYSDTRVYWLVAGSRPGRRVQEGRAQGGRETPLSFPFTLELKERTFFFAALKNGEEESFFGSTVWTDPVDELISVSHIDPSPPGDALLEIALQGGTEFYHQVKILLNDVEAGEVFVDGQDWGAFEISIPHSLLLEGDNIITLSAEGGSSDVSFVDYIRLTYQRTYAADDDALRFMARGGDRPVITGFSSASVRVMDITYPTQVFRIRGSVQTQGSGYAVTIDVPGPGERTLLAFTEENIKQVAGIAANQVSDWHERTHGADVVIIAHQDFLSSVEPLKDLREQQGWTVELIDVEDLYDEFSFGAKSPWALRDFLNRAYNNWTTQPRFVLLVGDASFDPRNYLGLGDFDLVPTKMVDTNYIKTASDDWFADFNDDGLPEMAVGRLPVSSVAEADTVVGKIVAYDGVAGTMNEALLVADDIDFFDYEGASTELVGLLPPGMTVVEIFRGQNPTARIDLLNNLNLGQLLVNYIGHGSAEIWRGNLFNSSDAMSLTNSPYLPFFISMTCLNGYFHDVQVADLAEALLKAEQGGAVAVWTSSSLTYPSEQAILNRELMKLLFNGQNLTLGEAIILAKQAVGSKDIRKSWILFGDPTIRLR